MYISKIRQIVNYRNLSGCSINFNCKMNFIIGENNIGKTNILELLNILFTIGKFSESDFFDICQPIEIILTVNYDDAELGFFENNFDIEDEYSITLVARQESVDERIEFCHDTPAKTIISAKSIKKLNTLYYFSQRLPGKEVDFRKTVGSGKVLNYLIQHSLNKSGINENDIIKKTKLSGVVDNINDQFGSINSITGDYINAYINTDASCIISRMLEIGDENGRDISKLGEGIQYAFNILLQIIEIIYNVKSTRKEADFKNRLIEKSSGEKLFPLFIVLDEPEIHQHPYRQRSLIRKIQELIDNENIIFVQLLKSLFDIDGLTGQIFVATHSPNILLSEYKQFIRIYKPNEHTDNVPDIISGSEITLDDKIYKHLLRSFLYLKEAMFSKCIVFVEGDTENGALPVFARRMNLNLDDKGIGIIKLDGANSVENCMKLFDSFGIKTIAVIDKDQKAKYEHLPDVYFTKKNDFEEDTYDSFKYYDYIKYCQAVGAHNTFIGILKKKGVAVDVPSFLLDPTSCLVDGVLQKKIMKEIRKDQLTSLKASKNASKAIMLAEYVTDVPLAFKKVIKLLEKEVK
jgi:putative ATP-dependent endonuclease of OLD family